MEIQPAASSVQKEFINHRARWRIISKWNLSGLQPLTAWLLAFLGFDRFPMCPLPIKLLARELLAPTSQWSAGPLLGQLAHEASFGGSLVRVGYPPHVIMRRGLVATCVQDVCPIATVVLSYSFVGSKRPFHTRPGGRGLRSQNKRSIKIHKGP